MLDDQTTTKMNHSEEFENLAAAVALGAISAEETAGLSDLIKNSGAENQKNLAELRRVNIALAFAADAPADPSPSVKDRLMRSLNGSQAVARDADFAFVRASEGEWQIMMPGVSFKSLFNNPATGCSTMLIRMAAGSILPAHHHDHTEELYLLEGDCHSAGQCLHAGDYHRAERGSAHGATFTERGCLMIVHSSRSLAAKP
jgi:quercetin dioxygenase-like cupin family protein